MDKSKRKLSKLGIAGASLGLLSIGGAVTCLQGCAFNTDYNFNDPESPRAESFTNLPANAKALVLSSGGPRGFVHAGVLKAFDEIGVRPDLIVGASAGSLVGAIYACGVSGKQVAELAMNSSPFNFATLAVGGQERFSGSPLASWVNSLTKNQPIETFKTRFAAVAMRASDQKLMAFTRGDAGVAVQASCAIAGVFTPVKIRGEFWLDPDLATPMPVRLARQLGAVRVISVDASAHEDKAPAGAERYRKTDLMKRNLTAPDAASADLNLHPFFGYWVSMTSEFREKTINAGYQFTLSKAKEIERLFA